MLDFKMGLDKFFSQLFLPEIYTQHSKITQNLKKIMGMRNRNINYGFKPGFEY